MRRKGYKPYGKYVKTISELKKDDSSVFYVGRINPRYLGGAIDLRRHSRYVILTGYRYNHYMARHREMKDYEDLMPFHKTDLDFLALSLLGAEDWKSLSEVEKRPQALKLGPEGPSQLQTSSSIRRSKSPGWLCETALMPSVLEHPDVVGKSRFPRALRFIFSQQYDKRYLSLIVEIKRKKREHEVISFFFEGERDIRVRRRRALVTWEREIKETTRPDRHPGIS